MSGFERCPDPGAAHEEFEVDLTQPAVDGARSGGPLEPVEWEPKGWEDSWERWRLIDNMNRSVGGQGSSIDNEEQAP